MAFNSLHYFLFLPVVYLVYYFAGERARWWVLLAASLIFYAALDVPYLLAVLALVALTTYSFGIWIDHADSSGAKRAFLWSGIAANVLTLVVMKYLPFLSENLNSLLKLFGTEVQPVTALVAIGVSYYVFQAVSYLINIYLEIQKPEPHLGYFALYLAFFPKLLQGPIERGEDSISQFKQKYEFDYDNMRSGMLLFACGLFKKVVVADRLGLFVDTVYGDVHAFAGLPLLLATYAYAFQIYMDFSGYTDMALGSALLFNIKLTQNFSGPYLATSVADFWRRWHISFSTWILDYVFKPLQMQWRDWKTWGTAAALMVAFLVSGIWHGASWGFVIWGGLHGFYMTFSAFYRPYQKKIHKALGIDKTWLQRALQIFCTFNLVSLAWIFFRAGSLGDAWYVLTNMLDFSASYASFQSIGTENYIKSNIFMGLPAHEFITATVFLGIIFILRNRQRETVFKYSIMNRWLIYYTVLIATWFFHVSNTQFLYFKF